MIFMSDIEETYSINKIHDVLLATVPLDFSDKDIDHFQRKLLNYLEHHEVNGVILDISKVEIVDSFFARTIAETVQMIDFMGIKMVVAGMKPNVAITTIELGFRLENVLFALNVDIGFELLRK
jgi:rsbT antagonist protein RsbS